MRDKVLIAGISGASLGTEIAKCLDLVKNYEIYGCDISSFAYGHYSSVFKKTFLANIHDYIESVLNICLENNIKYIIPGGEQPNILLAKHHHHFAECNIKIVSNNEEVVSVCSSKNKLFEFLNNNSILIPKTYNIDEELVSSNFPCIIKPSEGSGGSNFVYIAKNERVL